MKRHAEDDLKEQSSEKRRRTGEHKERERKEPEQQEPLNWVLAEPICFLEYEEDTYEPEYYAVHQGTLYRTYNPDLFPYFIPNLLGGIQKVFISQGCYSSDVVRRDQFAKWIVQKLPPITDPEQSKDIQRLLGLEDIPDPPDSLLKRQMNTFRHKAVTFQATAPFYDAAKMKAFMSQLTKQQQENFVRYITVRITQCAHQLQRLPGVTLAPVAALKLASMALLLGFNDCSLPWIVDSLERMGYTPNHTNAVSTWVQTVGGPKWSDKTYDFMQNVRARAQQIEYPLCFFIDPSQNQGLYVTNSTNLSMAFLLNCLVNNVPVQASLTWWHRFLQEKTQLWRQMSDEKDLDVRMEKFVDNVLTDINRLQANEDKQFHVVTVIPPEYVLIEVLRSIFGKVNVEYRVIVDDDGNHNTSFSVTLPQQHHYYGQILNTHLNVESRPLNSHEYDSLTLTSGDVLVPDVYWWMDRVHSSDPDVRAVMARLLPTNSVDPNMQFFKIWLDVLVRNAPPETLVAAYERYMTQVPHHIPHILDRTLRFLKDKGISKKALEDMTFRLFMLPAVLNDRFSQKFIKEQIFTITNENWQQENIQSAVMRLRGALQEAKQREPYDEENVQHYAKLLKKLERKMALFQPVMQILQTQEAQTLAHAEEKRREEQKDRPHCAQSLDVIDLEDLEIDDETKDVISIIPPGGTGEPQDSKYNARHCYVRDQLLQTMANATPLYVWRTPAVDEGTPGEYDPDTDRVYQLPLGNIFITAEAFEFLHNPEVKAYNLVAVYPNPVLIGADDHVWGSIWGQLHRVYDLVSA